MTLHYTLYGYSCTLIRTTKLMVLGVLMLAVTQSNAQVGAYGFTPISGTYTPLVGGTSVPILADDIISATIALPFTFTFNGVAYSSFKVSSNGFLTFNTGATSSYLTNDLDFVSTLVRPLLAPLWDDLEGSSVDGATATYQTSGVSPNQVFTFEWNKWQWRYVATGAVISFQVKLYETSNNIEFVYQQEATAVNTGSASIGLAGQTTGSGNFLSLDGTGVAPIASSTTEYALLATKPATGQIYRFTPPSLCTGTPSPGSIPTTATACSGAGALVALNVTGYTTGTGITFQWEESDDNGVGDAWANAVGGTGSTTSSYLHPALPSNIYYRCKVTCTGSGLFDYTNSCAVTVTTSPTGDIFANPIIVPSIPAVLSGDNLAANCWTNNYGQSSPDVYYQVVATCNGTMRVQTCASTGTLSDTYIHILDAAGVLLQSDDDGCPAADLKSSDSITMTAGSTYYIVVEGFSTNTGTYTVDVTTTTSFSTFYADADGDFYGDLLSTVSVCDGLAPTGYVGNFDDCDDTDAAVNPTATEVCNGYDDNCNGLVDDADPGVVGVSTWFADADGDGFGDGAVTVNSCSPPGGYVDNADDCDDTDASVNPGAAEVCSNGVDDNCDGEIDEGAVTAVIAPTGTVATCKNDPLMFSVEPCAGCTYQWFKNDNAIPGAVGTTYSTDKAAYYNVQVNAPSGCFDLSDYTLLNINPQPNANISAPNGTSLCTTVKLKASYDATYTYQWYLGGSPIGGATAWSHIATSPGSYYCDITNAFGCSRNTASMSVTSCREDMNTDNADILNIYPNPTSQVFNIDLNIASAATETAIIRIYNVTGEVVFETSAEVVNGKLFEQISIDNQISGGIYLVNIHAGNKEFNKNLVITK